MEWGVSKRKRKREREKRAREADKESRRDSVGQHWKWRGLRK
jgi:hypothetical protein